MSTPRNNRTIKIRDGGFFASLRISNPWSDLWYLTKLRCVTLFEGHPVYQYLHDHCKICDRCYANTPADQQRKYAAVLPHHLVHKNSVYNQMKCTTCSKAIINVTLAKNCQACVKEYQRADKERLDQGWGIPVVEWFED